MKLIVMRLAMAMGLLAHSGLGAGCDSEPEGSCTTHETGSFSGDDPGNYESHVCRPNTTASACAASSGTFREGGDCILFDLFHIPAAGA